MMTALNFKKRKYFHYFNVFQIGDNFYCKSADKTLLYANISQKTFLFYYTDNLFHTAICFRTNGFNGLI